jgi:hypothetical protein
MSANLVIGSSHALNLARAIGDYSATTEEAQNNLLKIKTRSGNETSLLYALPRPEFMNLRQNSDGAWQVTYGSPMAHVRRFNQTGATVVLMLGGNEPNGFFFYKNPKPFDFYHPDRPETDVRKQILPLAQMREIVRRVMFYSSLSTSALARELPLARKVYISPPPPIPSKDHIRKFPEIFDFDKHEIEDAAIRLKIHMVQVRILKDVCKNCGVEFIDSDRSNTDEDGFLKEEFWEGCTHATPSYYANVVTELDL